MRNDIIIARNITVTLLKTFHCYTKHLLSPHINLRENSWLVHLSFWIAVLPTVSFLQQVACFEQEEGHLSEFGKATIRISLNTWIKKIYWNVKLFFLWYHNFFHLPNRLNLCGVTQQFTERKMYCFPHLLHCWDAHIDTTVGMSPVFIISCFLAVLTYDRALSTPKSFANLRAEQVVFKAKPDRCSCVTLEPSAVKASCVRKCCENLCWGFSSFA